jgi:outer membrane lipopolysaccharide assembly protein LptE/RlpB
MLRWKPGVIIAVLVASALATSLAACGWHW